MCPEPNGDACIRCRRPAPPIDSAASSDWESVISESGTYLGVVCGSCIADAQHAVSVGGKAR
jgi:hypothetical protein